MNYKIRELEKTEIPILENFLYEAIFQRDQNNLLPRGIINQPELKVFIEDFGKPDDLCLVAVAEEKIIGAVWTRILHGKGFGSVNDATPEFAISLYKDYRGKGIGTALMKAMLQKLRAKGYKQTSLAVQKNNYAVRMYEAVGFTVVRETDEEYIMVCKLN